MIKGLLKTIIFFTLNLGVSRPPFRVVGVKRVRLGWLRHEKSLGNYTHFLVYTASSLVEQSTPYALEIFDEFASAAWFRRKGGWSDEKWKLYPWRVVNYRPKMSQMRYVKSIYFQMVECFVFCFCMFFCALFGIGSCLLVNVFDTSKLWDYAFESLTLRRLWLLFFLFAHESNMQVMIVSEHEPIVSMIVYNGINCLNWIAKTYVR